MFAHFNFFKKPQTDKPRRSERAQGLLEFAMILPLLLLFLFGVVEVGRMLAIYSSVSSASRQAARYGAVAGEAGTTTRPFYQDCAGMRRKAQSTSFLQPLANADISIRYDHGLLADTIGFCATNAITPTLSEAIKDGDRVVISITTTYRPIVPIVPLPALPMTFQAAHTIFTTIVGPTPTPLPNADLKITKSVTPTRLLASAPNVLTYTILVTNVAPLPPIQGLPASDIVVTDTLPTGVSVSSIITSSTAPVWTCTWSGVNIRCYMPFLGSGNAASPIVVRTTLSPRVPGLITNTAWVSNSLLDSLPADNIVSATTIISTWVDLELTKTSLVNPVAAGSFITYQLSLRNNNWVTATAPVVTDTLPVSATFVSFSGTSWSMTSGAGTNKIFTYNANLLAGTTAPTLTIIMQAPNPGGIPACSCVVNTATAGSTIGDPFPDNNTNISNTTSIVTDADLVMFKSASQSVVNGGNTYSYTLRVTNNGPSVATSVLVSDTIPAGATIVGSPAGSGWSCGTAGNLVSCSYTPALAVSGVTPNIIITVASPEADAVLVNTATVSSTQPDPVPGNNSASATTTVNNCHHDLVNASRSSISASPSDVPADNTTTSRVTVTLRDACDVVIVSPPYNQQLVTLIQSAGRSDTVTLAPGFSNPTSTGIVAFDVKSGTPGTTTYTASADDVGPNPSVLIASNAPVNFYDCVVVGEQPLGNTGQTFLEFTLTNGSGMNRKLVGVTLTYPGGGNILQATLQSTGVWSGSGSSPFSIGSSGWTAGTDAARTISNGAPAQVLKLDFNFGVSGPPGTPNTYVFTTNWTDDTGGRPCSSAITVSH